MGRTVQVSMLMLLSRIREVPLKVCTGEPLNKGHFGGNNFVPCREVVLISEVKNALKY